MSIRHLLIQRYLKETYVGEANEMVQQFPYEEIQKNSVYKVGGDLYIKFFPVKDEEIYEFSISTEEGEKEVGTVYKIQDGVWKARPKDLPDAESTGSSMLNAAIIAISFIGEI